MLMRRTDRRVCGLRRTEAARTLLHYMKSGFGPLDRLGPFSVFHFLRAQLTSIS